MAINDVFDKLLDRDQAVETHVRRTLYHYDLDGVGQVTVACPRCHQLHPWMVGPSAAAYGLCPCGTTLHLPYDPKFTFDVTLFENPANVLSAQTLCNLCRGSELFPISSVGNDDRFSEFIRCNYCGGRLRHTSGSRPLILTPEIVNVVALDSSPAVLCPRCYTRTPLTPGSAETRLRCRCWRPLQLPYAPEWVYSAHGLEDGPNGLQMRVYCHVCMATNVCPLVTIASAVSGRFNQAELHERLLCRSCWAQLRFRPTTPRIITDIRISAHRPVQWQELSGRGSYVSSNTLEDFQNSYLCEAFSNDIHIRAGSRELPSPFGAQAQRRHTGPLVGTRPQASRYERLAELANAVQSGIMSAQSALEIFGLRDPLAPPAATISPRVSAKLPLAPAAPAPTAVRATPICRKRKE